MEKAREDIIEMMKFSNMKFYDKEGIEKAYLFLNRPRELFFEENEWKQLVNIAFSYLKNTFYVLLGKVKEFEVEKLEKYFLMSRPLYADEEEWKEMQADIYSIYVDFNIEEIKSKIKYNYFSEALELMGRPCPTNLPKEYWTKYLESSKKIVESQLITYIYETGGNSKIESIVHGYDLSMLNQDRIETVLYDMLSSRLLLESVEGYIEKRSIPQWIKDRQLFKLEKYLLEKGELEELLAQNKMDKVEIDNLKERITKQLELVDAVLRDPSVLDYIEDYCDIFSKGNFENLRKVAKSMVTDNK